MWLDCNTVRIFACSSTREQSNKRSGTRLRTESETGERRYGRVRLARLARVRLLRHALPISLLILRRKPTVLQSMMWQNVILFNLVPSLYSHHKHENTDVSTCEKFKFVWWNWRGQNLFNFGAAYFASLEILWTQYRFTAIYLTIHWGWTTELLIIICTNIDNLQSYIKTH